MKRKIETRNEYRKINPKSKTKVPEVRKIETYTKVTYTAPTAVSPASICHSQTKSPITSWRPGWTSRLSRRSSIPALLPLLEDPTGVQIPDYRRRPAPPLAPLLRRLPQWQAVRMLRAY